MSEENVEVSSLKCDACRKDFPMSDIRFMSLKMCCKVEQVPLCKDCWEKYTKTGG
ncbi:MAG: hypothetical protein NT166_11585 [Candidatus Aminicenantes bacterium]|nr:hypothetical protein [Candidatus Aminicenantes bacterium]